MVNVNNPNLFTFLILVSLCYGIREDSGVIKEQREIASRPQLENNFGETQGESVITTAITEDDENFDDNEHRKVFTKKFKLYEKKGNKNKNGSQEILRDIRETISTNLLRLECLSCYANGTSKSDEDCFKGLWVPIKKCGEAEQCFTEINYNYIQRGCTLPGIQKFSFTCKCPLCNNKPANVSTYYEYRTLTDWEYDNSRMQNSLIRMDLLCKVCETGTNEIADRICRMGTNVDHMLCGRNQLCFTFIDDETDFVSRGCVEKPSYNSMFYYCNKTLCNVDEFENYIMKHRLNERKKRLLSTAFNHSKKQPIRQTLLFIILLSAKILK